MSPRRAAIGLLACLTFAACSEDQSTAPTPPVERVSPETQPAQIPTATGPLEIILTNIPIRQGTVTGTFTGVLTITSFAVNSAGQLLASGTLVGTQTLGGVTTTVNETFTNVLTDLFANRRCTILELDIGPIFLNVLGLVVETNRIQLDITAVAGPGALLGNLLCALVGLLDQGGPLATLQNLINQINAILAG